MKFMTIFVGLCAATLYVATPTAFAFEKENIPFVQGEITPTPAFDSLAFKGGGEIRITYGDIHSVTVISGDDRLELIHDRGSLKIQCKKPCRKHKGGKYVVDVTTPALENISFVGGGSLSATGNFTLRDELNISMVGGGDLTVFDLPANEVNLSIVGGGSLGVTAEKSSTSQWSVAVILPIKARRASIKASSAEPLFDQPSRASTDYIIICLQGRFPSHARQADD